MSSSSLDRGISWIQLMVSTQYNRKKASNCLLFYFQKTFSSDISKKITAIYGLSILIFSSLYGFEISDAVMNPFVDSLFIVKLYKIIPKTLRDTNIARKLPLPLLYTSISCSEVWVPDVPVMDP